LMEDPLHCDTFDLPGLFLAETETLGAQDAGYSSSQMDTFRPGTMQLIEEVVEESTNGSALWFTGNQVAEPLAGAVTGSEEFEIGLEFSDEPSDGSLSGCWIGQFSAFSDSKTWSSLAMVVFLYSVLLCLLWFSPKPQAQSFKFMEVQLVSMGGENTGGTSLESSASPGATLDQGSAETSDVREVKQETAPVKSEVLPIEKKIEPPKDTPKKHAKPVPVPHKEQKVADRPHPEHSESLAHTETASADSGPAGAAGAATAVASNSGTPGGEGGTAGGSGGPVELAFGAADGPSFLHRVLPSYPASAKRLEKQGTVLLRVTIDECGRPCQVEVLQKAGFGLDEEAVRAVKESTFVPAKRNGKPLTCKALLPIRFVLKQS
jgi:periplasmic protein TonB